MIMLMMMVMTAVPAAAEAAVLNTIAW